MRKFFRFFTVLILVAALLWSAGQGLVQLRSYASAEKNNHLAMDLAFPTANVQKETETNATENVFCTETATEQTEELPPEEQPVPMDDAAFFLRQLDLAALRKVNPEVLGWIYIPDTAISYPLMQTDDQNKYLNHAWDGTPNGSGSIFLEKRNARDMTDFNTIIYGHHMANGTMFQPLVDYRNADFLASHPYVYVLAGNKIFRYRIFSAYEAPITSHTYRLVFRDDAEKLAAIEHYLQGRTDVGLTPQDHILTLSTCTGLGDYSVRWVVQGVLDASWEK